MASYKHHPPTIQFLLDLPEAQFAAAYPDQDLAEVRRELERLRDSGVEVVPVCDNVDATGRCQGHEREAAGEQDHLASSGDMSS